MICNVPHCDHLLLDIVAITILAVMCGAEDRPDVQLFGESQKDWLESFLPLPDGAPSHDTFRRVFGHPERAEFARALSHSTQVLQGATGGKLISIVGKALRRSCAKRSGKDMLHLVTAWASEHGKFE